MSFSSRPPAIAIIGAGFSGVLVATHLLKTANRPLMIQLIERRPEVGQGVAYSTTVKRHLLNVSAGKMSAFPDDPGHLLRWLQYNHTALAHWLPAEVNASTFIPRSVFGLYLQSILEEAIATAPSDVRLDQINAEAIGLIPQENRVAIALSGGQTLTADRVVLALGNAPVGLTQANHPALRHAWAADALSDLAEDATVLLVGTGLTMVDTVVSLYERGHRGPIYACSRRGLAPQAHQSARPYPAFLSPETAPPTVRGLMQRLRREIAMATAHGYDWRSVIDSLRPITQALWQQLPPPEQRRFLRHVTPYWDVHRHRIAPEIQATLQERQQSGQLTIAAGRILDYQLKPDGAIVTLRRRHSAIAEELPVNRVIQCTGVQANYHHAAHALIASLREQGLMRPNSLGLGLDTAADGALLNAQGQRSPQLYTLGTPRKGNLWETSAVNELRKQASFLADTLLQSLPVRVRPVPTLARVAPVSRAATEDESTLMFRQFFDPESSTYTYLVADRQTKAAVLVDTVLEQGDRDLQAIRDLGLSLRYCLETHIHADHITGAGKLRQQTGCQVLVPQNTATRAADHTLADGEGLNLGQVRIEAIATPGHTNGHLAFLINHRRLLTGDALLIRGCGRTDLQSGDAGTLYDTVTQRLFTLPDSTLVYPGHDYQGRTVSTIGEEKRLNPRFVDRSRDQFITLMAHLGLSYPQKMHQAVPANESCGDYIPEDANGDRTPLAADQFTLAQNVSANTAIFESYFAMYI